MFIAACSQDGAKQRPPSDAGIGWRELSDAEDARGAVIDKALETCDPVLLARMVRIAADTEVWHDLIETVVTENGELVDAAHHAAEHIRDRARERLKFRIFSCIQLDETGRVRPGLLSELARPENVEALVRLVDGGRETRKVASNVLTWAPVAALRPHLDPFVDSDPSARFAVLAITDLPITYPLAPTWATWIVAQRTRPPDGIGELLKVAAGNPPPGTPPRPRDPAWLDVRRASIQEARQLLAKDDNLAPELHAIVRMLCEDPDARIRRDAVRIVRSNREVDARAILERLVMRDSDRDVRLAAAEALHGIRN